MLRWIAEGRIAAIAIEWKLGFKVLVVVGYLLLLLLLLHLPWQQRRQLQHREGLRKVNLEEQGIQKRIKWIKFAPTSLEGVFFTFSIKM